VANVTTDAHLGEAYLWTLYHGSSSLMLLDTTSMKIYFGFTVAGNRATIETARRVVQLLEGAGHEVLTRHLVDDNAWERDRLITPQEIFARDMKWLQECDLFIAEVSGSSFGIGFETGYLLGSSHKKAILFFRCEIEKSISLLITGNTHPNCTLVPYGNENEVENFVRDSLSSGSSHFEAMAGSA